MWKKRSVADFEYTYSYQDLVFKFLRDNGEAVPGFVRAALIEFADQTTDYTFPPGYRRMITFNLANELAPWYPVVQPDPRIAKIAAESIGNIKRANTRIPLAVFDRSLPMGQTRGAFNYRTGDSR